MDWLDFFALTLAASAVVDVWRNGSIFAMGRATLEARADEEDLLPDDFEAPEQRPDESPVEFAARSVDAVEAARMAAPWYWRRMPLFFAKMLNCAFCFSHHTPWVLAILFFFPAFWLGGPWAWLLKLPVYSLAATRLGTILNASVPPGAKYERNDHLISYTEPFDEPDSIPEP